MKPILLTITGPTASGKSFLLDELTKRGVTKKIVSYTTREARVNETEGVDYYFISQDKFNYLDDRKKLIESFDYNGASYGTSFEEIDKKMGLNSPGAIILEPNGVQEFNTIGSGRGWKNINVFVYVPLKIRTHRIVERTMKDMHSITDEKMQAKIINRHLNRAMAIENEKIWLMMRDWDLIVPGDNVEGAITLIMQRVRGA